MAKHIKIIFASVAMTVCMPSPLFANESKADEVARKLEDPMTQYMVAGALAAITKQLLDMKVKPFVDAMDKAGAGEIAPDVPPDATLGQMAGPGAERLPKEIVQRVPKLMDSLAGLASAYGDMLPELEAMAKRAKEAMPRD